MHKESDIRLPLILGDKSYKDITDDIIRPIEANPPKTWYILLMISIVIALWGIGCIVYLLGTGVGSWGLNKTVGWAWDITNFVWWVGIGHAGTLISAVLLLFRQKWRFAINRAAEAMTIFAVFGMLSSNLIAESDRGNSRSQIRNEQIRRGEKR